MPARLLALLMLLLAAIAMDRAAAHSTLRSADPEDGATLARAPERIVLGFDDAVRVIDLRLVEASGRAITLPAAAQAIANRVEAVLPSALPNGVYVVSWRVTSADSHPVAGMLVFAVGTTIPPDLRLPSIEPGPAWHIANVVLRFAVVTLTLISGGGAFFAVLVSPLPALLLRRLGTIAALGAGIAILAIPARGALLLGLDAWPVAPAASWQAGLETRFGASMIIAALGLLALAATWRHAATARLTAATCGLVAIASFAVSGHAAVIAPAWICAMIVTLHVAIAAFWFGALAPLAVALDGSPTEAAAILRRFSRIAFAAVGVLIIAGGVLATLQLESPAALEATSYGRTLLAKLVGVIALVTLAGGNRLLHLPALAAGDARAVGRLRRALHAEMAAACFVLAATAILSLTTPPRAEPRFEGATEPGVAATALGARTSAVIDITPGRSGGNRVVIEILDLDGQPSNPRALEVIVQSPDSGDAVLRRVATPRREGGFAVESLDLARAGRWTITLEVRLTELELETLTTEITIP